MTGPVELSPFYLIISILLCIVCIGGAIWVALVIHDEKKPKR